LRAFLFTTSTGPYSRMPKFRFQDGTARLKSLFGLKSSFTAACSSASRVHYWPSLESSGSCIMEPQGTEGRSNNVGSSGRENLMAFGNGDSSQQCNCFSSCCNSHCLYSQLGSPYICEQFINQ
jgi:hypothetical protein